MSSFLNRDASGGTFLGPGVVVIPGTYLTGSRPEILQEVSSYIGLQRNSSKGVPAKSRNPRTTVSTDV